MSTAALLDCVELIDMHCVYHCAHHILLQQHQLAGDSGGTCRQRERGHRICCRRRRQQACRRAARDLDATPHANWVQPKNRGTDGQKPARGSGGEPPRSEQTGRLSALSLAIHALVVNLGGRRPFEGLQGRGRAGEATSARRTWLSYRGTLNICTLSTAAWTSTLLHPFIPKCR